MTFLAPIAGLVAAAIALPSLILLYFLKLRRRPVRVTSTLLWQQAVHDLQVNTPFKWLRLSWILLLQVAALLLLLTAFARPAIVGRGEGADRVIIMIDQSASMSARLNDDTAATAGLSAGATRFDLAIQRALSLVKRIRRSGAVEATVIGVAARPRALLTLTTDHIRLEEALLSLRPTDQPGDLEAAYQLADSLLAGQTDDADEVQATNVYTLTDGVGLQAPLRRGPVGGGMTHIPEVVGAEDSPENLGILAFDAHRDSEDPALVRLFCRIGNAGASAVQTVLEMRVDDKAVQTKSLAVPGRVKDDAGEAATSLSLELPAGGLVTLHIVRRDMLDSDNHAGVFVRKQRAPNVILVGPGDSGPEHGTDMFLSSVLSEMFAPDDDGASQKTGDRPSFRIVSAAEYERLAGLRSLGETDLVIFDRVVPARIPPVSSLSFGATVPIAGMAITPPANPARASTRFLAWQRTHPLLRYVALDAIVVSPAKTMTLPHRSGSMKSEILASGAGGPLIAEVEDGAVRRVFLAFDLDRTSWGPDASFPVFMVNALEYLAGAGGSHSGGTVRTTDVVEIAAAPGADVITLEGPLTLSAEVDRRTAESSPVLARFASLPLAGVYRTRGAADEAPIVANLLSPSESLLVPRTAVDAQVSQKPVNQGQSPNASPVGESVEEIWHWFVIASILLLLPEWLLVAWRMR